MRMRSYEFTDAVEAYAEFLGNRRKILPEWLAAVLDLRLRRRRLSRQSWGQGWQWLQLLSPLDHHQPL